MQNSESMQADADQKIIKVLVVEPHGFYTQLLKETLQGASRGRFELISRGSLDQARKALSNQKLDIILLDLSLPDSQGMQTFTSLYSLAPTLPIIILTAVEDE